MTRKRFSLVHIIILSCILLLPWFVLFAEYKSIEYYYLDLDTQNIYFLKRTSMESGITGLPYEKNSEYLENFFNKVQGKYRLVWIHRYYDGGPSSVLIYNDSGHNSDSFCYSNGLLYVKIMEFPLHLYGAYEPIERKNYKTLQEFSNYFDEHQGVTWY